MGQQYSILTDIVVNLSATCIGGFVYFVGNEIRQIELVKFDAMMHSKKRNKKTKALKAKTTKKKKEFFTTPLPSKFFMCSGGIYAACGVYGLTILLDSVATTFLQKTLPGYDIIVERNKQRQRWSHTAGDLPC